MFLRQGEQSSFRSDGETARTNVAFHSSKMFAKPILKPICKSQLCPFGPQKEATRGPHRKKLSVISKKLRQRRTLFPPRISIDVNGISSSAVKACGLRPSAIRRQFAVTIEVVHAWMS